MSDVEMQSPPKKDKVKKEKKVRWSAAVADDGRTQIDSSPVQGCHSHLHTVLPADDAIPSLTQHFSMFCSTPVATMAVPGL
jgi:hypothetical protein